MAVMSFGQVAYQGYFAQRKGLTFDGKPMLAWVELGDEIQVAWMRGAAEAINTYNQRKADGWRGEEVQSVGQRGPGNLPAPRADQDH